MNNANVSDIIKKLKMNRFFLNCEIPLEYSCGYPIFLQRGGKICLQIPFLRYKITGRVDKTLVYPIRYVISISLPDGKFVGFEDLSCRDGFGKIDFSKPIGYFRHDAVKNLNKAEYKQKRAQLYEYYDIIINSLLSGKTPDENDVADFRELLGILLEPSVKPIYKYIAKDFYDAYL